MLENLEEDADGESVKPRAWITYDGPGHFMEYVVSFEGYDMNNSIPQSLIAKLKENIGDTWTVLNRGTRVEIVGPQSEEVEREVARVLEEEYKLVEE